jgi:hypothetical protein
MTAYQLSNPPLRLVASTLWERFILKFTHTFAIVGAVVILFICGLTLYPELRTKIETQTLVWLINRFENRVGITPEPEAVDRATAIDPSDLPKQQAALAHWLSKKYRVAPEPVSALVAEAYQLNKTTQLDPTLILAIMAIESSFNPFAQSSVGAQGLMQVMTKVHTDKFDGFGGKLATFDPVSNLRVGVKVLQDCIARAGSVAGGLRLYVGAGPQGDDGGYTAKVLTEQKRLKLVAAGQDVPTFVPSAPAAPAASPADKADTAVKPVELATVALVKSNSPD